jgi:flagellar protein FlaJ
MVESYEQGIRIKTLREFFVSFLDAYRYMDIPVQRYILLYLGPAIILGIGAVGFAQVSTYPPTIMYALYGFGVFVPLVAMIYPRVLIARRANEINEKFHLFVTHLTIMSLTNINRVEIFRTLANEDEYGYLAEEMGRLTGLVDTWNMSLEDACRVRSKSVPSDILKDFYQRLAYNVGAGQAMSSFLVKEQSAIISQFSTSYEASLDRLSVIGELYLSIVLAAVFTVMFAVIAPFLTGSDPVVLIGGVLVAFLVLQVSFVFVVDAISPEDPVWFQPSALVIHRNQLIHQLMVVAGVVSGLLVIGVIAVFLGYTPLAPDTLPVQIYAAIPTTPFLVPGLYIFFMERRIIKADSQFPSFIRGLGAIESVKQTSTASVLQTLRKKDFGTLTKNIDALYKRLNVRIDDGEAWRYFAAETGSHLIQNFSDMYNFGRGKGGEPEQIGTIISQNFSEVLNLREYRGQSTSTLTGILYGITAASSFSFFVSIEVIRVLIDITDSVNLDTGVISSILNSGVYDVDILLAMIVAVVLINAAISSVIIRKVDRRYIGGATFHFVLLTWLGMLMGLVTEYVSQGYLTF